MTKLLQNTLEIIGNISLSCAGYLLKLNNNPAEVIAFVGEERDKYNPLNYEITGLYRNDGIFVEGVQKLTSYKKLASDLSLKSLFVKKIFAAKNKNFVVFLFLFSNRENNYNDNNLKTVLNVAETLTDQLKDYDEKNKNVPGNIEKNKVPGSSIKAQGISNDELLNVFFNTSEDFIFILDSNGFFINVNQNGSIILDYTRDELEGRHFLDFIDTSHKPEVASSFQEILKSERILSFNCRMISKGGKKISFEINTKSIFSEGIITGVLGVGKNVTQYISYADTLKDLNYKLMEVNRLLSIERTRSDQKKAILEELNSLKNEFISNISHELRTPLASIIGFSETIASDPNMPAEMRSEFNQIILNEGKRLAKLINDILDLSRIESGTIELSKIDFDILKVLNDVINSYTKQVEAKNITLTSEIPSEEIIINADKDRITQIFHELISNAVKFTKEGGRISVVAQSLYREFELIISDTGVGIPEKDLPYIFQKFYRVSRPGTEIPGTGLGLVFVKQIVDLHKGLISVQSGADKGTSFVIKLPKSKSSKK